MAHGSYAEIHLRSHVRLWSASFEVLQWQQGPLVLGKYELVRVSRHVAYEFSAMTICGSFSSCHAASKDEAQVPEALEDPSLV